MQIEKKYARLGAIAGIAFSGAWCLVFGIVAYANRGSERFRDALEFSLLGAGLFAWISLMYWLRRKALK